MQNLSQNGCSVRVATSTELILTPTAVALGKFDGLHRGHQRVIQPILHPNQAGGEFSYSSLASWQSSGSVHALHGSTEPTFGGISRPKRHAISTVVTFSPHPQEFFSGQPRALLTPLDEKAQLLRSLGIEQLVLVPFDKELSALTPEEFVETILVQRLQAVQISVGQDFRFGSKRSGNASDLQIIAAKYNIPVTIVSLQTCVDHLPEGSSCDFQNTQEARISTSLIREILESGDISLANQLLGRPYNLIGSVIQGQQLGRTIGFPTANLQLPLDKFLPCLGVYAVRVFILEQTPESENALWGVMNIGNRPTVGGTQASVEVHLLDFVSDLYGKKLMVQLVKFLRPETKFPNLEALKTQIQLDCMTAREVLNESG